MFSFGNKEKERLLFLEIELEKLRLENEILRKKVKEAEAAIQIIAANQAYLATEVTNLVSAPSQEKKDPPLTNFKLASFRYVTIYRRCGSKRRQRVS